MGSGVSARELISAVFVMNVLDTLREQVTNNKALTTYQLVIKLSAPGSIEIGQLGEFWFPAGHYVYTGSARRNLLARVQRHLQLQKTCRWHIDYFLVHLDTCIVDIRSSDTPECRLNQQQPGKILVPRFGASDCRQGCGSHLKYLGTL